MISFLSKVLLRVFSSTTVWRHKFFVLCLFYCPALISVHHCWKDHSLDYMDLILLLLQQKKIRMLRGNHRRSFWAFKSYWHHHFLYQSHLTYLHYRICVAKEENCIWNGVHRNLTIELTSEFRFFPLFLLNTLKSWKYLFYSEQNALLN